MSQKRVNVAPISPMELSIVEEMQRSVRFVPYSMHKRFIRTLSPTAKISDGGRQLLAYIGHRYRRQWRPSPEQMEWIVQWGTWIKP